MMVMMTLSPGEELIAGISSPHQLWTSLNAQQTTKTNSCGSNHCKWIKEN